MEDKQHSEMLVQLALLTQSVAEIKEDSRLTRSVVVGDGNGNPGLVRRVDGLEDHFDRNFEELSKRVAALESDKEEHRGDRKKLMFLLASGAFSFLVLALSVWLGWR